MQYLTIQWLYAWHCFASEKVHVNWREALEQIAPILTKEKQKSYHEITKRMHAGLYDDLRNLKEIRY